jgi:hypothetical protein
MSTHLLPVADVAERIERGEALVVAGDEEQLGQLPAGAWVGGTVPGLGMDGADRPARDLLWVAAPPGARDVSAHVYDVTSVRDVYADLADTGFGIVIIPAGSRTHLEFALHAPGYRGFAVRPLVGWIAGVPLDDLAGRTPTVFSGTTRRRLEDGAVVLHVSLPPGQAAEVGVVNIFEQGRGPAIRFPRDGFEAVTALVDGVETDLAQYVRTQGLDTRLPLVADYYGQMVNVSFQAVDSRGVRFYSPVFAGLTYRHARPVADQARALLDRMPADWPAGVLFSCTCILNHYYSGTSGPRARGLELLTFGEVAYQLLNQTIVYLRRHDVVAGERTAEASRTMVPGPYRG